MKKLWKLIPTSFDKIIEIFKKVVSLFENSLKDLHSKRVLKKNKKEYYFIIENIFRKLQKEGRTFNRWSLSKSSIRNILKELDLEKNGLKIVELGGGVSTFFWNSLKNDCNKNIECITFEHDKEWGDYLQKELVPNITIIHCGLKQLSDDEKNILFLNPDMAIKNWEKNNKLIPTEKHKLTRINNAFYDIPIDFLIENKAIDLLIVDGPHGNGRSISFPLFFNKINEGCLILIDDYTHYPFVDDLKLIFNVREIACENSISKKWILFKVLYKKL